MASNEKERPAYEDFMGGLHHNYDNILLRLFDMELCSV